MIYDSLDHIDVYKHVHPGVYKGLRILRDTDFSQLPDGKYEVDGEELFYSLMTYQSKPVNDTPETHKKYIDIQCVLSGGEAMAVAPLEEMEEVVEARPEGGHLAPPWPHPLGGVPDPRQIRRRMAGRRPRPRHRLGRARPVPQSGGQGQSITKIRSRPHGGRDRILWLWQGQGQVLSGQLLPGEQGEQFPGGDGLRPVQEPGGAGQQTHQLRGRYSSPGAGPAPGPGPAWPAAGRRGPAAGAGGHIPGGAGPAAPGATAAGGWRRAGRPPAPPG